MVTAIELEKVFQSTFDFDLWELTLSGLHDQSETGRDGLAGLLSLNHFDGFGGVVGGWGGKGGREVDG
jgi:hypothetical protein